MSRVQNDDGKVVEVDFGRPRTELTIELQLNILYCDERVCLIRAEGGVGNMRMMGHFMYRLGVDA